MAQSSAESLRLKRFNTTSAWKQKAASTQHYTFLNCTRHCTLSAQSRTETGPCSSWTCTRMSQNRYPTATIQYHKACSVEEVLWVLWRQSKPGFTCDLHIFTATVGTASCHHEAHDGSLLAMPVKPFDSPKDCQPERGGQV